MRMMTIGNLIQLGGSAVLGALLATMCFQHGTLHNQYSKWRKQHEKPHVELYGEWLDRNHLRQLYDSYLSSQVIVEADYLRSHVKLLCWIMLNGDGASINAWPYSPSATPSIEAIHNTWGKRCTKTVYFSRTEISGQDTVVLKESHDLDSWTAIREALDYLVQQGYLNEYDWFYRTEDDTFPIIENLLYYLSVYNVTDTLYLGHAYTRWGSDFNTGGPGSVLSRTALRRLNSHMLKGHCPRSRSKMGHSGDRVLGECLAEIGIGVQDTRDKLGRGRFLTLQPDVLLIPGNLPWSESMWTFSKYMSSEGPECCSDYAVSFHMISPSMMYIMDYLIYHLKPYGIRERLIRPLNLNESSNRPQTRSSHAAFTHRNTDSR